MDETGRALVEAAERGEAIPRVQVALGSALATGLPIAHDEYAELQPASDRG
jgi:hypothetical protein